MTLANADAATRSPPRDSTALLLTIGTLGWTASNAQLALFRELLGAFDGNELTIGTTLSVWLVLTAAGTWLGAATSEDRLAAGRVVLGTLGAAVVSILQVLTIRGLRDIAFPHGTAISPLGTIVASAAVLAPFCLCSGALLTMATRTLARDEDRATARVYAADAIGSVAGAAAFTFILSPRLDHASLLAWAAAAAASVASVIGAMRRNSFLAIVGVVMAGTLITVAIAVPMDVVSTQWQHRSPVVFRRSTPYGRLVVTQSRGQLTFFENGVPVLSTANTVATEESVHYALAQRPNARRVLLIGGSVGGSAKEVLRYPGIVAVTCIELDPGMIEAGRILLSGNLADDRLDFVATDGRRHLAQTDNRFDVVIVGLPDPSTYQVNRYYTTGFFAAAKRVLAPDGVVGFGIGHYENYVSPELAELLGSTRRTVATVFAHGLFIPGGRVFCVASDGPLTADIAGALERTHVRPIAVNSTYLDGMLTPDRLADVQRATTTPASLNTDLRPILSWIRLRQWFSQFAFPARGFAITLGILGAAALLRFRGIQRMVFAAGFSASVLELAILLTFPATYGSLYQQLGRVVAMFMLGLAIGAAAMNRQPSTEPGLTVTRLGWSVTALAVASALALPFLGAIDAVAGPVVGHAMIVVLTFAVGAAVGAQFAAAAAAAVDETRTRAPRLFSADLVGAALGGIAASAFLIPLLGVPGTCLATAGLNLACVALGSRAPRVA